MTYGLLLASQKLFFEGGVVTAALSECRSTNYDEFPNILETSPDYLAAIFDCKIKTSAKRVTTERDA
jgi:hypothetical protein